MTDDDAESSLVIRGLETLRVSRLRRIVLIGTCAATVALVELAGAALWHWWPLREWMLPALLIPVLFVVLALFFLKAPERIRKRLWVLIVPPLLVCLLVWWAGSDLIGSHGGLYGGLGTGIALALINIMQRGWPR